MWVNYGKVCEWCQRWFMDNDRGDILFLLRVLNLNFKWTNPRRVKWNLNGLVIYILTKLRCWLLLIKEGFSNGKPYPKHKPPIYDERNHFWFEKNIPAKRWNFGCCCLASAPTFTVSHLWRRAIIKIPTLYSIHQKMSYVIHDWGAERTLAAGSIQEMKRKKKMKETKETISQLLFPFENRIFNVMNCDRQHTMWEVGITRWRTKRTFNIWPE